MIMGYIDPGAGSVMLQLLAGSIIGSLFIIKNLWKKIKEASLRLVSHNQNLPKAKP